MSLSNGSRVVTIEGLIGCGKSVLVQSLRDSPAIFERFDDVVVFAEPIKPHTLHAYLDNQKKYAFSFQTNVALKRLFIVTEAKRLAHERPRCLVLIDRGIGGDQAFALAQLRLGFFGEEEYSLYREEIGADDGTLEALAAEPGFLTVYARCAPLTSWERTKKRANRDETKTYDEKYMKTIFDAHEEILKQNAVVVDWDADKEIVNGKLTEADVRSFIEAIEL